ncbi:hypothetical protein EDD11_005110 [Mortierella claussenii]|nr:hypothetical protein EDD11_005110 [Mortierella claussenii]
MSFPQNDLVPSLTSESIQAILQRLEAQEKHLEAQSRELDELRTHATLDDPHVSQKTRSTILTPYPELLEFYPAVGETQFYEAVLPKGHTVVTMADYHYNSLMEYQPPSLHPLDGHLKLSAQARAVNDTLALYQSKLAHETLRNPSDPATDQRILPSSTPFAPCLAIWLARCPSLAAKEAFTLFLRSALRRNRPASQLTI